MKAPIFIAALAGAYLLFVAIVVLNYEAGPEDLDWDKREIHNLQVISALHLGQEKHQVVKLLGNADFSEAKPEFKGIWWYCFTAPAVPMPMGKPPGMNAPRCYFRITA